tara:strand:+ start:3122 stop:3304 length:183 start_codon:yes stop_codon:yes gene_type:complete
MHLFDHQVEYKPLKILGRRIIVQQVQKMFKGVAFDVTQGFHKVTLVTQTLQDSVDITSIA